MLDKTVSRTFFLLFQWLPASLCNALAEDTWSLESAGLQVQQEAKATGTVYNLANIASTLGITIKVNGVDVTTGAEINRGDTLDLALRYELSNSGGGNSITGDDSIIYTLPAGLDIGNASGNLMDGGTIAGTYVVSGNQITFTYNQTYLDSMGTSNIIGTLNLTGTFEKDSIPDTNIGQYSFDGAGTITVHFAPPVLNGYKTADTSVLYAGGNTIEYQVQLTSDGTFDSTQVTDVLGSNLSYVPGSATINGSAISDPSISGQALAFSVGTVSYNEPLILKYKARVSDDALIYGASSGLVNNVTWQSGDETGSDSTTTWYTKDWMQKSSSWVDTDTGIIQWTITVNDGYPVDMTGMVLSDAFSAGQTLVGNVSVSGSSGLIATLTPPSSASGFTYTVGSNGESGAQKLTITYQTQIDSDDLTSLGSHQYTNTIDATNSNWPGFSASDTSSITRSNSPDSVLSKAVTADIDNDSAEWTLNITVPDSGDMSQMVITDSMWDNYAWFDGGTVVVEYGDGTAVASDQYTVTYPNLDGDKRKTMNITFASTFVPTDSLIVRYKTDYDPALLQNTTHTFANNANLAYTYEGSTFNDSASASWTLDTRQKMTKTADNFVYDSALGVYTLQWTLKVNQDTDWDGLGETDFSGQTVSVVDTLQEGLTYLPDTLSVEYMKDWQPAGSGAASTSLSTDGSTITFVLNPIDEHIVTITYKTSVDEALLKVNGGATLENAAILLADGNTVDDVTAQYTTQGDMVNKTAYQASGDAMIQYTIDVNALHLDLDPTSDTLTLSDVLAQDLLLVTGSITVTDIGTGTALSASEYTVGYNSQTRQMTITMPDNRALRVKFSVILQGEIGQTKTVSNTATLSNVFGASSESGGSFIVNKVTGTVEAEEDSIRAIKVDSNSITTTLANAEFTLYKVNLTTGTAELVNSQLTLSVGTATFGSLAYDQLYYLAETQAPTGYVLASDPYYFIIPGDDGISTAMDAQIQAYLPEGESYVARGGDVLFSNTAATGYTQTSAALTVQKALTSGTLAAGQFSFLLTETTAGATYTQTASNQADGTVAFSAINYAAPGVYTYEIAEVVPSGDSSYVYDTHTVTATVTVTDDGTGALQAAVAYSGDTTFTNTAATGYTQTSAALTVQ
ncbi:MAG TPA: FctA domain-containing protein, partial [Candidatus Limiplasma sp.]|nr:FctA domain-containing protein [Candidatus Limiplasma sp.]